ncbi:hypothetical protein EsDP_00003019 [Epichloe bromicola]|uniref:Uncharacterized protein n=1 Tax=Epichloe bromicola TaxID=79588 RepID=A0ABQ0CMH8_9HYPO
MASAQRFPSPLALCAAAGVWLIMLCLVGTACAAKYTITRDLVGTVSLVTYTETFYVTSPSTVTMSRTGYSTVTLKPSVTAAPFSTRTSVSRGSGDDSIYGGSGSNGVVYIYRYFSPGAIPATDMVAPTERAGPSDVATTTFYRMVEYTAPSSCPTPFTLTATVPEYVPSGAEDQVSIESATTSVSTYRYGGAGDGDYASTTTYTYVAAFLASTSHPTGRALRSQYIYSHYLSPCISPYPYPTQATTTTTTTANPFPYPTQGTTTTANSYPYTTQTTTTAGPRVTSGGSGRDGDGNRPDDLVDNPSCPWSDCGDYPYWGMILATVLPTVFLLGFVESYLWFRRLMMGRGTLRVGTISWILLCFPLGFLARKIPARGTEDQQTLSARWKKKSFRQCLGHWLRWGLRSRYPVELLGAHPTYKCGDPVADEKRVEQGHGSNGEMVQSPVAMEKTTNQEQAPILPPLSRFAHGNIRCVSSDSVLTAMSEEAGSKAKDAKGKSVAHYGEGMKTKSDPLDPQEGRAPRE